MTGVSGQLRIANQIAAELGDWTVVPGPDPGTKAITAACVSVDAFLVAQEPDVIQLDVGRQRFRWRVTGLEIGGGTLRGVVAGAPEVR
jgi:hypothetical protein